MILDKIFDFFLINNFSLSTVESVTGGKLSNSIIKKAGASKFFKGSLVTYSIESKINILQIDKDLIYKFSPVSKEISYEMVKSGKKILNTDYCISTTGNAGPSTNDHFSKVGQIFISIATPQKIITEQLSLDGSREEIIEIIVEKSHKLLLENLIK
ncbi:MAG: CinA family protein [Bacteroidota bacterium]|nr:CinA family protein [Bacteroidota bacterium]|tara:strand:+ start:5565 stop:6032 length:468 start_codon:yes stop_codon:yes gene_type:complete